MKGKRIAKESERIDRAAIRKEGWLLALRKCFAGSYGIPVWRGNERSNDHSAS